MEISTPDLMIHVDETLALDDMRRLEDQLRADAGVISACTCDHDPHLLMVTYNADSTSSHNLLGLVKQTGVHAELIGL
ncbi:MAG: hypothetical protein KGZ83_18580 [Sulfuricella sp.]|nr:hypothetical protein [Sulfuricella sp.]